LRFLKLGDDERNENAIYSDLEKLRTVTIFRIPNRTRITHRESNRYATNKSVIPGNRHEYNLQSCDARVRARLSSLTAQYSPPVGREAKCEGTRDTAARKILGVSRKRSDYETKLTARLRAVTSYALIGRSRHRRRPRAVPCAREGKRNE